MTLGFCFGIQSLALKATGGRTTKSESNFHSTIARIQQGMKSNPSVILSGSSRTGRMPAGHIGGHRVANMGCDGGSAMISLRAIDQARIPAPPTIVIEGNTLHHELEHRGHEILQSIGTPWFNLGIKLENFSAAARPSAFAYSFLLSRKLGLAPSGPIPLLECPPPEIVRSSPALSAHEETLVSDIDRILNRLRKQGTHPLLVILPPVATGDVTTLRIPRAVSNRSQVPLLDLGSEGLSKNVTYTDGIHMSPQSATAALITILAKADDHIE